MPEWDYDDTIGIVTIPKCNKKNNDASKTVLVTQVRPAYISETLS